MKIEEIKLQNFRSFKDKTVNFSPGTTVILGDNARGKTNLFEAIYLLSSGKSFHAERDTEMLRWGTDFARVSGDISEGEEKVTLEIVLTGGLLDGQKVPLKKYMVNDVTKRSVDFTGNFKAVLFWPEDLELIVRSPVVRRRYLDFVLSGVDREYRRSLGSYERGIRQRNKILQCINEGRASAIQLTFWNQLVIKTGNFITSKREEFIDFVNKRKSPFKDFSFRTVYDPSLINESRLEQYKNEEIRAMVTLVGPHRDDFGIEALEPGAGEDIRFRDIAHFGSRGEQRLAVLWLKLGELDFVKFVSACKPVLLLDDILSELDHPHREIVFEIIKNQQTIISTTDTHFLSEQNFENITRL